MKLLQKAACLAVACLLCAAPVRAEPSYKATELTFPQEVAEGEKIQSFSVHGNRLDLFAETICEALYADEDGSVTVLLRHFTLDSRYDEQTKAWTLTRYVPGV